MGGNPTLKRKSLVKLIELEDAHDFFISNGPQEFASSADILAPISTDHSPVLFSLSQEKDNIRSKGFWKFNSSLTEDQNYINEIKDLIRNFYKKNDCDFSR